MSVNKHIIIGRLGKAPDIRTLENGTKVANFTVATDDSYTDKDGNKVERTDWHNVVLWKKRADVAEMFLNKGSLVYIEGKSKTRKWEKDGVTRYTTELHGDNLTMLGKKQEAENGNEVAKEEPKVDKKDDLPF